MIPYSRESLLQLKSNIDEENRILFVNRGIEAAYRSVISSAKEGKTQYHQPLFQEPYKDFYKYNMDEILRKLRELFPDSKISLKTLLADRRGEYHDVSGYTAEMYKNKNINLNSARDFIVFDWS